MKRLHPVLFVALCLAGMAASIGLTVREVARTAPIALTVTHTSRTAQTTVVMVDVRNTTDINRCVSVRVAARDRAGHDLAAATASLRLALPAHGRRSVQARLTLTQREYDEKLDAFYPSQRPCSEA